MPDMPSMRKCDLSPILPHRSHLLRLFSTTDRHSIYIYSSPKMYMKMIVIMIMIKHINCIYICTACT